MIQEVSRLLYLSALKIASLHDNDSSEVEILYDYLKKRV